VQTVSEATLFLTLELARRIELAEAQAAVQGAEVMKRMHPEMKGAVERIAGGFAVYCGANSPITQAVGLGLDGPVSEDAFDRLEDFYRSRGETVRVETCPLADHSLFEIYGRRCYRVTEFSSVLARPLGEEAKMQSWPAPAAGVTIARASQDETSLWTETVCQGFAEHYPVTDGLREIMKMFAMGSSAECFLARVDGEIAGGGTLSIRGGVAGLFWASTLPAFRNRGVQTALLQTRLAQAEEAGCDIAVSLTQPGSTSQRNIMRQGFQVLYTRVKFEKAWG
jgi:GNAT superfamily N-acetyltransferase